ncbi:PE domain-containing protein [Kutzneria buriramensis]|uniref:PE family protein n=1 Tax=Kutzneria buriramensis TaxID=1045776 RepID=A0A3E0HAA6_9PSEU|nr:PE domain-containing protein [Kutzneria buriramensis]REH40935.1 PE family protein [Kutzneria buriramensis]
MAAEISLGGGYSIDLDDAQKFIDALQNQLQALQETAMQAGRDISVFPPGNDDYSAAWARAANAMAGQHFTWNRGKQQELIALIDKVTDVVNKYKQTEHDNTMRA